MKKPYYNSCCFCCSLKIGSCVFVGFTLFFGAIGFLIALFVPPQSMYKPTNDIESKDLKWFIKGKILFVIFFAILVVVCVLFFKGISSNKSSFVLPFIVFSKYAIVTISIALPIFMFLVAEQIAAVIVLGIGYIIIMIWAYLVACVNSFYVVMKNPQNQPQNHQNQNVHYTANRAATSNSPSSVLPASNPSSSYPLVTFNTNSYQPTSYGQNSPPPNYSSAVNDSLNNDNEKSPIILN